MVAVLFVCMGNICRSPMAEGAFRAAATKAGIIDTLKIDSAGTIGYHAGSAPDSRAQATALKNGADISSQKARQVTQTDFETFDYILAMDNENHEDLMALCPAQYQHKIKMFLSYAPHLPITEMPDPYYGHTKNFETCYSAAVDAADGLLAALQKDL
ncbi:low molecular weight protein-tyrosine-phosphatase [Kordiimonas pumila]|uniref:protein-tyrosine-phosphatase n=1 Tax=Kordiimonas pumila TaxID=2161677 RepID=A0ABV7CZT4_9PROT|nr:low molecular weight protein-tyrosine-phosphatase [Kordiimonas pumila]